MKRRKNNSMLVLVFMVFASLMYAIAGEIGLDERIEAGSQYVRSSLAMQDGISMTRLYAGIYALVFGSEPDAWAYKSEEDALDIVTYLCGIPYSRELRLKGCPFLCDDGGISLECGGQSDLSGVLLMFLKMYMRAEFSRVPDSGLLDSFIRTYYGDDGLWRYWGDESGEEVPLRLNIQAFLIRSLEYRSGARSSDASFLELRTLWSYLKERLNGQGEFVSVYDLSLFLQGSYILGYGNEVSEESFLLSSFQAEDGHWSDKSVCDDVLVTMCALSAMRGAQSHSSVVPSGMSVRAINADSGDIVSLYGIKGRCILECKREDAKEYLVSMTVIKDSGEVHVSLPPHRMSADGDSIALEYIPSGAWHLVIRYWDIASLGLVREEIIPFHVEKWSEVKRFGIVGSGTNRVHLKEQYDDVKPEIACEICGNYSCDYQIAGNLIGPGNSSVATFRAKEINFGGGSVRYAIILESTSVQFRDSGYYELKCSLSCQNTNLSEDTFLLYVDDESMLSMEYFLNPKVLPIGHESVENILRLVLNAGIATSGIPASFTVSDKVDVFNLPDERVSFYLENIRNADSRLLENGWIICLVDYGKCVGEGQEISYGHFPDGSCRAYPIVGARALIEYEPPGDIGVQGPLTMEVYSAIGYKDKIQLLDQIGVVHLMLRQDYQDVLRSIYYIFTGLDVEMGEVETKEEVDRK